MRMLEVEFLEGNNQTKLVLFNSFMQQATGQKTPSHAQEWLEDALTPEAQQQKSRFYFSEINIEMLPQVGDMHGLLGQRARLRKQTDQSMEQIMEVTAYGELLEKPEGKQGEGF